MKKVLCFSLPLLALVLLNCSDEADEITGEDSDLERYIMVPAERSTIQGAVDLAGKGDTIMVADGVYSGPGNYNIDFDGKYVILVSQNGPAETIINVGGTTEVPHVAFNFSSTDESRTVIDGFTIRNGFSAQGSGLNIKSAAPTIKNCVFVGNEGSVSGGAIRCKSASPKFVNCTFVGNRAPVGATIMLIATSQPVFENCIIVESSGGEVVTCSDTYSFATFSCSNIYGNESGDWVGCLEDQAAVDGNMSSDPMFCDPARGDYSIDAASPCAEANNNCGATVGALDVGCSTT